MYLRNLQHAELTARTSKTDGRELNLVSRNLGVISFLGQNHQLTREKNRKILARSLCVCVQSIDWKVESDMKARTGKQERERERQRGQNYKGKERESEKKR